MQKKEFRRIEINELPKKIPNYKKSVESKDTLVYQWLKNWLTEGLNSKKLNYNELLPLKADLAYHLGVSVGTVQNAIRYLEDEGYLVSKQRIGTLIKDVNASDTQFRKLTSKREKVISELKRIIVEGNYKIGDILPSAKELGKMLGSCSNTTRLALENLSANGYIKTIPSKGMESTWHVTAIPEISDSIKNVDGIQTETLVSKVEEDIKRHIQENYQIGQKLCAHAELAQELGVSIKTIHDAMKTLIGKGYLLARRGRYGTTVLRLPNEAAQPVKKEDEIFASAQEAAFYNYQKIERYLKKLIREKYKVGDKLPSMGDLAKSLNVSTNTIKKALQNLYEEGCVDFSRGRYGGTFVIDIPEDISDPAFKWLAVNPQYVKVYKK